MSAVQAHLGHGQAPAGDRGQAILTVASAVGIGALVVKAVVLIAGPTEPGNDQNFCAMPDLRNSIFLQLNALLRKNPSWAPKWAVVSISNVTTTVILEPSFVFGCHFK